MLGASPTVAMPPVAMIVSSRGSTSGFGLFAIVLLFALGPLVAACYAFRAALALGRPMNRGPWQSRAWACALLTAIDSLFFNLCVVLPSLLMLVMLIAYLVK